MSSLWALSLSFCVLLLFPVGRGETAASALGLLANLTLVQSAASAGAVCLDGSVLGYHLHPGFGSGANNWPVDLELPSFSLYIHLQMPKCWLVYVIIPIMDQPEGGGWCNNVRTCVYRLKTRHGSSKYMERQIKFSGILSNDPTENPDFYDWNRVRICYCDGASFAGEGYDEVCSFLPSFLLLIYTQVHNLYFRGQRIWSTVIEELMSRGMRSANQVLLSGCSAGGLASILHCDEFRALFSSSTRVNCLADAGFCVDAVDVAGGRTLRSLFQGVVSLQGVAKNLSPSCLSTLDPTSCFFPQNVVGSIQTPTFILNAAYDVWQLQQSLAPKSADPHGLWQACKFNHSKCDSNQIQFLQGFRNEMLAALRGFSQSNQTGLFINSCFTHCQTETQDTWSGDAAPSISNKGIAAYVGDWYFDRSDAKAIDCPYPCDTTCHHTF